MEQKVNSFKRQLDLSLVSYFVVKDREKEIIKGNRFICLNMHFKVDLDGHNIERGETIFGEKRLRGKSSFLLEIRSI